MARGRHDDFVALRAALDNGRHEDDHLARPLSIHDLLEIVVATQAKPAPQTFWDRYGATALQIIVFLAALMSIYNRVSVDIAVLQTQISQLTQSVLRLEQKAGGPHD